MEKVYVTELSQDSRTLFITLAKAHGFSDEEIESDMQSEITDLFDTVMSIGFRICGNYECRELFTEGYIVEDPSETFCSRQCAEKVFTDIVEEDYGTDIIYWTEWEE